VNVLHLDEQLGWRGGEQQASWLIQGLARRGHRVLLAGRPESAFLKSAHGGIEAVRIPLPFRSELDLATAWRLSRAIRNFGIDLLHAHSSHAHAMAVMARLLAGRGKVVVSRRVSFPPKRNAFNRWKYEQPDCFLAVSGKVAEVLREYGLAAEKVRLVYSSVDLARLDVAPLSRSELGLPEDAPLVVSAGALVRHKDHATLLAALPKVLRVFPKLRLLIAGEGELRGALERQIADLGLGETVRLLGHRTDVPRLTRAADLYVSSSWSEGLGTSVLEALACGTPVVAAVAGGVPEMVKPGETGYLVANRDPEALADAICASLSDRENAHRMALNGRQLVEERFVTERMVEGTLRVYEELLQPH
jgi:glycosyltransferase involved in cell wall biosynthesis